MNRSLPMVSLRAVVHIGPMKTGTTAFAAAATQAQSAGTLPVGVLYPTGALWFDDERSVVKHHQLNASARSAADVGDVTERTFTRVDLLEQALAAVASVARARASAGQAVILLVAEGLSNQMTSQALTAMLRRHVDSVDYVLVARRQQRAIGSSIAHGVKDIGALNRHSLNLDRHLALPRRARRFDYASILERWQHDGAVLHVLPYDESAPGTTVLTDEILDRVGVDRLPIAESLSARRSHPSFSEEGLRELAAIKRRFRYLQWLPGAEERYRATFSAAWEKHHRAARAGSVQPWRLDASDERRVEQFYAASNQKFRELLGDAAASPQWHDWFAAVGIDSVREGTS